MRKWIDYVRDYSRFRVQAWSLQGPFVTLKLHPCLGDKSNPVEARGHYFHQDLLVAQKIFLNNPVKHVDVGSRMDGFVAHVASFRKIEVIDVRPLEIDIPNVQFTQADVTAHDFDMHQYCDSVSSLHALEHFGLGRYCDQVDFHGYLKGIESLDNMLVVGGKLYISVPIGTHSIEFNAHRIFSLRFLFDLFQEYYSLDSFSYFNDDGDLVRAPKLNGPSLENSFSCQYGCGIFEFTKVKNNIPLFGRLPLVISSPSEGFGRVPGKRQRLIATLGERVLGRKADAYMGPATRREERLIKELKEKIGVLQTNSKALSFVAGMEWTDKLERVKRLVLEDDPARFLRWDVIQETMFVAQGCYIEKELEHLKQSNKWRSRWKQAIKEVAVGSPVPYNDYPQSSANLIHHAYHICQFEEKMNININRIDIVIEFGGGYGSMCRLLHKLGFKGTYIIFDLAPFCALQQYYLQAVGLKVRSKYTLRDDMDGVFSVSTIGDLKKALAVCSKTKKAMLFVGTWSISEAPLELRKAFYSIVSGAEYYLFAYQNTFAGIDNRAYFVTLRTEYAEVRWQEWPIEHLPGNYYLFGVKRPGVGEWKRVNNSSM